MTTTAPDTKHADSKHAQNAIQDPGWPSRRLAKWPLPTDWMPKPPKKKVGPIGYQKVVGTVQSLFNDDALQPVLSKFQDYCFQQDGLSNANARDRYFFFDALAHDLVFFAGDQGHPIVDDLPIDPKVYNALPQMKASHYDLYRVENKGFAGGVVLKSLLRDLEVKAGARLFKGPAKGATVLARVVQIGRGLFLDEPWLSVSPDDVDTLRSELNAELTAVRSRHGQDITTEALLKVAGYHLYEAVAARQLCRTLEEGLPQELAFAPHISRYRLRTRRDLPDLDALPKARPAESDASGRTTLVTVDIAPGRGLPRSLRDALVSIEDKDVVLIHFITGQAQALRDAVVEQLPKSAILTEEQLTPTSVYRALRHTVSKA